MSASPTPNPQAMPATISPRKLAHIVLRTGSNFDAMVHWYKTVLGATVVYDAGFLVFLSYDDEHHRIAIARGPDLAERPQRSVGLDHVAFTYDTLEDLLATYARLKQVDITPLVAVNHGPTTSLYYVDPDRNRIELQVDNFTDMLDATTLMRTTFGTNPVGTEFDPDQMLARLKSGVKAADLIQPTDKPQPPTMQLISKLIGS